MNGRELARTLATSGGRLAAAALRGLPWLLLVALLLVLGWRSAGWLWRLWPTPPAGVGLVEPDTQVAGSIARHWFGVTPTATAQVAAPAPTASAVSGNVRLLGVIAGGPRPAALLKIDNLSYEAIVGEEFADGWRLVAVEPDAVRLLHNGREMRIVLPDAAMTTRKP